MLIIDNTSDTIAADANLTVAITETGGPSTAQCYDIAAEDQHYAEAITSKHAVHDMPGTVVIPAGKVLPPLRKEGLPPHLRQQVQAKLDGLMPEQRTANEEAIVAAVLRNELPRIRLSAGLGEGALPYHRELLHLNRRFADLEDEFNRYANELAEVHSYGMETDPATGRQRPKEILRIQGPRREAYSAHMEDLSRQMRLLFKDDGTPGIEGARSLQKALHESVQLLKQRDEIVAEKAEVERLTNEQVRADRIAAKVASRVRMQRNVT